MIFTNITETVIKFIAYVYTFSKFHVINNDFTYG